MTRRATIFMGHGRLASLAILAMLLPGGQAVKAVAEPIAKQGPPLPRERRRAQWKDEQQRRGRQR